MAVAAKPIDRFEHDLRSLIRTNPARAAVKISAALRQHDAKIAGAAQELGCSYRTLRRWISILRRDGHEVKPLQPRSDRPPLRAVGTRRRKKPAENLSA